MAKTLFGNLVSYKGKYLAKAKAKAENGNLVFAQITGSTTLSTDHADYDKDGYYIYAGGAEGHLVDLDTFKALRKELKELIGSGDLEMPKHEDGSYYSIVEYVNEAISAVDVPVKDVTLNGETIVNAEGVAEIPAATSTNVAATVDGASDEKLITEKAVLTAISNLGTVMDFKGVVEGESLPAADGYAAGDVIVWNGEEYVLNTDNTWHEIGQVKTDEAVLDLGLNAITSDDDFATFTDKTKVTVDRQTGKAQIDVELDLDIATTKEEISAAGAEGATDDKLASAKAVKEYVDNEIGNIVIPEVPVYEGKDAIEIVPSETDGVDYDVKLNLDNTGNVTLSQSDAGLKAEVNVGVTSVEANEDSADFLSFNPTTGDVKASLDVATTKEEISTAGAEDSTDDKLASAKAVKEYVDNAIGNIEIPEVSGDESTYSVVEPVDNVYTVKNVLADASNLATDVENYTKAEAEGLATDAYVKDYVAEVLAWEVLTD